MNCNKAVLRHFYGNGDGNGSRSKIIENIKDWVGNNREGMSQEPGNAHKAIIGSHKIGKNRTIEHSLKKEKDAGVIYFFINQETNLEHIDKIASSLFHHVINLKNSRTKNSVDPDIEKILEEKKNYVLEEKKTENKYLLLKSFIETIKSVENELKIVFIFESISKLDTAIYNADLSNECQYIFKIKVDRNEIIEEISIKENSIILELNELKIKPLSIDESIRMIRGEHPEVEVGICGITNEVIKAFFPKFKSSIEELIIKIVGCHPYLLNELCSRIIDDLNLNPEEVSTGIKQYLSNSIKKDSHKYNLFFENFFCTILDYEKDLFKAYKKYIIENTKPSVSSLEKMMKYGMIFKKNNKIYIPLLFKEYIIMRCVKDFDFNKKKRIGRKIVNNQYLLNGINYVLETVDKIPGVNLITAPIHTAVKEELSDLQKQELYEYLSSIINNSEKKTFEHISSLKDGLEDLKSILENIKEVKNLKIDDFSKSAINLDPSKIKLNDITIIRIEYQLILKTKDILLNSFIDTQSAYEFYQKFSEELKSQMHGNLLSGININTTDTNALIFNKIFEKYNKLSNSETKHLYISVLHNTQNNNITKDWLNFLEYLKTNE